MSRELDKLCINSIRVLSADAIQKAKSGHPGLPLGSATMAFTLWTKMNHNGKNPAWEIEIDLYYPQDMVQCLNIHYYIYLDMD